MWPKKVTNQIFQRLYYLISILATWLIFHASYDDKYENEIEYYHADESSFMCHCKIEPLKNNGKVKIEWLGQINDSKLWPVIFVGNNFSEV